MNDESTNISHEALPIWLYTSKYQTSKPMIL